MLIPCKENYIKIYQRNFSKFCSSMYYVLIQFANCYQFQSDTISLFHIVIHLILIATVDEQSTVLHYLVMPRCIVQ